MGMESFFINVIPSGIKPIKKGDGFFYEGKSKILKEDVLKRINEIYKVNNIQENEYSIDKVVKLCIEVNEGFVVYFNFEGCFAWYKESLELIYSLIKLINENSISVTIFHPLGLLCDLGTKIEFIENIEKLYEKKYYEFKKQFGELKFKVMPGKAFYKEYKRRKSLFYKIVSLFKGK